LLDALEVDARTRSRLIALADPFQAQILLTHEDWGAPLHLGAMLRAFRLRAKSTQADLARRIGVSQSAVAQWESGDSLPGPSPLQSALLALGASGEESVAILAATSSEPLSDDVNVRFASIRNLPHALCEPMMLFNERDLWWRVVQNPAWDVHLLAAVAQRTAWYGFERRMDEVASLAHRALRIADASGTMTRATPAFLTLAQARIEGGTNPRFLFRDLERWAAGVEDAPERAWTLSVLALALAKAEEPVAVRIAQQAVDLVEDPTEVWYRQIDLAKVHLQLDDPVKALEVLGDYHVRFAYPVTKTGGTPSGLATRALAMLRLGMEPEAELMSTLRSHAERTGIPLYQDQLAEVERALARFHRHSKTKG
ncbi:XRE family transcriptional regulator, partial [bacterium]